MPNYRELFFRHQAQTSDFPLGIQLEKAEGCYLYDTSGKRYLDLISGISVCSLGHGNEAVKEAIKKQVDRHMHVMVYGEFIQSAPAMLAARLASLLPPSLDCAYFVNSGAEATEGALKLAKRATGRSGVIAFNSSYHGSTHAGLSLNSHSYYTAAFRPLLPDITFINYNRTEDLQKIDSGTACVIVETVRGEAGYETAGPGFLSALAARCREMGALLVLDEIQCGMGRTGSMFAFEQENIIPDILLLGKALGAGMPMGAFIASRLLMQTLTDEPVLGHITTFGGHPVICAAAYAGIEELVRLNIGESVAAKEKQFRTRLQHPAVRCITGRGLMLALELNSFEANKKLIDACINDGVITDWFLFAMHKLRLAPPLVISEKQIDEACDILLQNLNKL